MEAIFEKICERFLGGSPTAEPERLSGGYMHKMYGIETREGKYAVKLLNPYIMGRETAMENYRRAEELEAGLERTDVPILPALSFGGKKMQEIDGQFFYLFEWFEGKSLNGEEITEVHCERMGEALAKIHRSEVRHEAYRRDEVHIPWETYVTRLEREAAVGERVSGGSEVCGSEMCGSEVCGSKTCGSEMCGSEVSKSEMDSRAGDYSALAGLLRDNMDLILDCQDRGNRALKRIPPVLAVCHCDMDSKNVLWKGNEFRIIDLECLSFDSPYMEVYNLALSWAGYEECNFDLNKFRALIEAYRRAGGLEPAGGGSLYNSDYAAWLDWLEWLEFNLRRTLGMEGDNEERNLGISMVKWAIRHLKYYVEIESGSMRKLCHVHPAE